jgi:formylglycine-generating enzyme required for sulfatase activity
VTEEGFSGGPILLEGRAIGLVFGREGGFGQAVPAAAVGLYLRGHEITWRAETATVEPATPSGLAPGTVRINVRDKQPYVWIPAGEFQMGCSPGDKECQDDETPLRKVRLTRGFWLGQTEVTVQAYKLHAAQMNLSLPGIPITRSGPLNPDWSDLRQPMANITWQEARSYCVWAEGRLPTEAEWEYAARAGATGVRYGELDAIAWYAQNSGDALRHVKQKRPNAWGLYDMLGSVNEWTADWYDPTYYSTGPTVDPRGPAAGQKRAPRGGSFYNPQRWIRVSARPASVPDRRNLGLGVRCACDKLP